VEPAGAITSITNREVLPTEKSSYHRVDLFNRHAFLDGYEHFNKAEYLQIAESACGHILRDYDAYPQGKDSASVTYAGPEQSGPQCEHVGRESARADSFSIIPNQAYRGWPRRRSNIRPHASGPTDRGYYGRISKLPLGR